MIRFARRSAAVACLAVAASLSLAPAAHAAPHWVLADCGAGLEAHWLPKTTKSGITLVCATTEDRNQAINDALVSGKTIRMSNATQALVQQNADSFLATDSPCRRGEEASINGMYAKCVG